jgi:hypothetical protein
MTKKEKEKEKERKKYGLLPPKIAEFVTASLGHDFCGSGGSIYNKDTSQNTLSASLIAITMILTEINNG